MTLQHTSAGASIPRQTGNWGIAATPGRSPFANDAFGLRCVDVVRPRLELAGAVPNRCATKRNAICTSEAMILQRLLFLFVVAPDEEYVNVRILSGQIEVDLGDRLHNFLLLTLARERLADAARGLAEASCGWMFTDQLARDLDMLPSQLNVEVFRIRKHLASRGVIDAAGVIERRRSTRQLRIGTGRTEIIPL